MSWFWFRVIRSLFGSLFNEENNGQIQVPISPSIFTLFFLQVLLFIEWFDTGVAWKQMLKLWGTARLPSFKGAWSLLTEKGQLSIFRHFVEFMYFPVCEPKYICSQVSTFNIFLCERVWLILFRDFLQKTPSICSKYERVPVPWWIDVFQIVPWLTNIFMNRWASTKVVYSMWNDNLNLATEFHSPHITAWWAPNQTLESCFHVALESC